MTSNNYDEEVEYCARCGAELDPTESYLCDFCRYDEMNKSNDCLF